MTTTPFSTRKKITLPHPPILSWSFARVSIPSYIPNVLNGRICKFYSCCSYFGTNFTSYGLDQNLHKILPHVPLLTKPGLRIPWQSVHVELSPPQTPQKSVFFELFWTPSQPKKIATATENSKMCANPIHHMNMLGVYYYTVPPWSVSTLCTKPWRIKASPHESTTG